MLYQMITKRRKTRMKDNILKFEYNMDNGYVEVYYKDGNILKMRCEEVESQLP